MDISKDIQQTKDKIKELRDLYLEYESKLFAINEKIDKYLETIQNNG